MKRSPEKNKKIVFGAIFAAVSILVLSLCIFFYILDEAGYSDRTDRARIDGELRHEAIGLGNSDTMFDLTKDETESIFETLQLVIPENETEITVRIFSKIDTENVGSYYLELDGIKDRESFWFANCEAPNDLQVGAFWDRTDDDGEYTHYFVLRVYYRSNISPVEENDYIKAVGVLYDNLLQARND